MKTTRTTSFAAFAAGLALIATAATAQQPAVSFPRPSPNASVSQVVGITEVALHYSRPGVKGRAIWGALVPYGEVWRAGANENTTISFSTPVKIEGHDLPAGLYGLQMLPTQNEWTVIFSKDADQWGAFDYKPEHDALRVQVKPVPAELQERLSYDFTDLTDTSAKVALRWERLQVPFTLTADTPKLVADATKGALRWQTGVQAASYCIQNDTCLDDAGRWIDASIALEPNFATHRAKALLLAKKNDFKGAVTAGEKALAAVKGAAQPPQPQQVADLEKSVADWKKK